MSDRLIMALRLVLAAPSGSGKMAYRLENKKGQGPFSASLSFGGQWIGSPNIHTDKGFSPKDREEFDRTKHLFGFESPEQAKNYFENPKNEYAKGDWDRLLAHGFRLKKYKAKKVWHGEHQVFFEPELHSDVLRKK